jgi:arginyl-tRNA synthetase
LEIKEALMAGVLAAVKKAIATGTLKEGELPTVLLEVPPKKEFGDFASNFAMQAARTLKCNPRMIAQAIVDNLDCAFVDHCEIAGPGFINFYLKEDWIYDVLANILKAGKEYGTISCENPEKIQVEYVSANPTGLLHVGHGRGAAVGSALANLLMAAGYDVEREYYINDAGNQMNNLAASINARYLQELGQDAEIPENGYHGQDIIDTAKGIVERDGDKYLAMDEKDRLKEFRAIGLKEKTDNLKRDLAAFNVHFDTWFSEQTLHDAGKIKKACDTLMKNGNMYEKDGALWLKSTAYGDDKDRVVIRDNGVPTYLAADIAYHKDKLERGFDKLINIWGADHHGYVIRIKAAIGALGYDPKKLEVMLLQMVSLFRNGELVKMSKRTGQTVTLTELIDEVGTDAARYFFIMRSLDSQLDFDLTLATEKSSENPVYYIQYAHARICSILRQVADEGIVIDKNAPLTSLTAEVEHDLIKKMGEYPALIESAARERAVHRLAHYVHELASLFHSFYNQCRIIGEPKEVQQARLLLIIAIRDNLEHVLNILGVSAPEKM